MYNLFYWAYSAQLFYSFDKYDDCKKSLEVLKEKYPDAKIWMQKSTTVCFEEFMDKTQGRIGDYERNY